MWHSVVKPCLITLTACLPLLLGPGAQAIDAIPPLRYSLAVSLEPPRNLVAVDVEIELPSSFAGQAVEFLLNPALRIESSTPRAFTACA